MSEDKWILVDYVRSLEAAIDTCREVGVLIQQRENFELQPGFAITNTRALEAEAKLARYEAALKQIRDSPYDHSCRWCGDPRQMAREALESVKP